jgi:hypothetical protein
MLQEFISYKVIEKKVCHVDMVALFPKEFPKFPKFPKNSPKCLLLFGASWSADAMSPMDPSIQALFPKLGILGNGEFPKRLFDCKIAGTIFNEPRVYSEA